MSAAERRRAWGYHQLGAETATRIVLAAGIRPGELVLDLGAGGGALTAPLLRAGARVIAVELHPRRVEQLRRRFGEAGLEIRVADLTHCRWPVEAFRVVANPPWTLAETLRSRLLATPRLRRADLLVPRWLARRWAAADPRISVGLSVRAEAFRPAAPSGAAVAVLQPGRRRR